MKKLYVIGLAVLLATALALPAQSAMWVGGELGANFIGSNDFDINASVPNVPINASATARGVNFDNPQFIGGLTIGYDFVNTGFGGYAYPGWMKYFSFATDFTYNRMSIRSQQLEIGSLNVNGVNIQNNFNVPVNVLLPGIRIDGYMAAWTFLFMAHYGFLPDSEVPTGRLIPYVGVGPCILFSGINVKSLGSASSTDICLVAEGGVRFMALKNVSLDLAFRYRYANPSYEFSSGALGIPASVKLDTTVNSYSILTRVSYHF